MELVNTTATHGERGGGEGKPNSSTSIAILVTIMVTPNIDIHGTRQYHSYAPPPPPPPKKKKKKKPNKTVLHRQPYLWQSWRLQTLTYTEFVISISTPPEHILQWSRLQIGTSTKSAYSSPLVFLWRDRTDEFLSDPPPLPSPPPTPVPQLLLSQCGDGKTAEARRVYFCWVYFCTSVLHT